MTAYATEGRSEGEEDQPGEEPIDDRYLQLQEEIRMRDGSMVSITAKMGSLMAQL